jgi:hypothetical protein
VEHQLSNSTSRGVVVLSTESREVVKWRQITLFMFTDTADFTMKIPSSHFYKEYHGHKISHLEALYSVLRKDSEALIWTAGDSSLDNKYW